LADFSRFYWGIGQSGYIQNSCFYFKIEIIDKLSRVYS